MNHRAVIATNQIDLKFRPLTHRFNTGLEVPAELTFSNRITRDQDLLTARVIQ